MEICRSPLKTVFGTEFKADNTVKMSRLSSDSCAPLYVFDFCWKASIIFLLLLPPPAKPAPTHCSSTRTPRHNTHILEYLITVYDFPKNGPFDIVFK